MKTAIILTGHMRSFDRCLPTLHWHLFRHFPAADFFVSTIEDADAMKANLLRVKYPAARVEVQAVKEQPDCVAEMRGLGVALPEEWHRGKPYTHEPHPISVHPQAVLRQLWQLRRGWEMFSELTDAADYGVIIRCRPDLWFHSFAMPVGATTPNLINQGDPVAFLPWWGRFGGVNDRFALLSPGAAEAYFETYTKIPELAADGCPIHPESLIAAALARGRVDVDRLFAEFSTLRANGELRPQEISLPDLAHLFT